MPLTYFLVVCVFEGLFGFGFCGQFLRFARLVLYVLVVGSDAGRVPVLEAVLRFRNVVIFALDPLCSGSKIKDCRFPRWNTFKLNSILRPYSRL